MHTLAQARGTAAPIGLVVWILGSE